MKRNRKDFSERHLETGLIPWGPSLPDGPSACAASDCPAFHRVMNGSSRNIVEGPGSQRIDGKSPGMDSTESPGKDDHPPKKCYRLSDRFDRLWTGLIWETCDDLTHMHPGSLEQIPQCSLKISNAGTARDPRIQKQAREVRFTTFLDGESTKP